AAVHREWEIAEANSAGNPDLDIASDWVDYESAGAKGPQDIYQAVRPALDAVGMSRDVLDLGLRSAADTARHTGLATHIVELRSALRKRLDDANMSDLVVPFEPRSYNREATIGVNLLFGA